MAWMTPFEALAKFPGMVLRGRFPFTIDGVPLIAERLPFRKRMNLVKGGVDMLLRSERSFGLPPTIQIEPTNICNLRCPLCPTGTDTVKRTKGFMSPETFKTILDEMGSILVCVILYGWGEPFLNKETPNFIEECTSRNILTFSSTNGHCLQTLDDALRVVDAGLTSLVIAIDGSTQEVYTNYRKCGDVEKVKRCISLIEKAKIRRGSKFPFTNLRMVVTRNNVADLPNVERLARSSGVNMFSYKSVGSLYQTEGFKSYEPREESMRRYEYKDDTRCARPPVQCPFPFRQPTVFWDGTLVGCEFDYSLQMPLGKIGEQRFEEIWNNSKAKKLRTSVKNGRGRPDFCTRCPYQDRVQNSCVLSAKELRPIIDRK
jgi:radical SAM protein with 4Fe4S-binding SPASM domain